MKCTEVERLLPLYVGNDLADKGRARSLAAHLESCDGCRRTLEEFRAAHDLLQEQPAPPFDEQFYLDIRARVLTDIRAQPEPRPSLFESLRALLMQRPAFAATLALLLVFVAIFAVVRRNSTVTNTQLSSVEQGFGEINPGEFNESAVVTVSPTLSVKQTITEHSAPRRARQLASTGQLPRKKQPVGENGTSQEASAPTTAQNQPAPSVNQTVPSRNDGATANDAQPVQAIARMEIQTSDPNIRIIWLSRKPSE